MLSTVDFTALIVAIPVLLSALPVTLGLAVGAAILGILAGIALGLLAASPHHFLAAPARVVGVIIRGTPLLVQIYLIYYGLPSIWPAAATSSLLASPTGCAILALGINSAAYTADIVRGSLRSVPPSLIDAARALGLSSPTIHVHIIAPLALRVALPTYGNEIVALLKATALASLIGVVDIAGAARRAATESFTPLEVYVVAAALYLLAAALLDAAVAHLTRRLSCPGHTHH